MSIENVDTVLIGAVIGIEPKRKNKKWKHKLREDRSRDIIDNSNHLV